MYARSMSIVIPEGISLLTPQLSAFISDARAFYGLSQEQVAANGGPRRQVQGWIENGNRDDADNVTLSGFDRAYGWPTGYTTAVAANFFEVHGVELNPALLGDEADAALYPEAPERHPHSVRKTLTAWRRSAVAEQYSQHHTCLGFDPKKGLPVHQQCALVTNVDFARLRAIFNPDRGTTVFDTQAVDLGTVEAVLGSVIETSYRAGELGPAYTGKQRIAVDPLTDLYDLGDAKRLAQALMRVRPDIPTTVERAAFTFLAIAAFGGDPLVTVNQLKMRHKSPGLPRGEVCNEFHEFWRTFFDAESAGAALAEPDLAALDLLAGILDARDSAMLVEIGPVLPGTARRTPTYQPATTMRSSTLTETEQTLVFYDSAYAPELPTCIAHLAPHRTTTFYRATQPTRASHFLGGEDRPGSAFTPTIDPVILRRSIGLTTAHDLTVLSQHDREFMGTLTNFASGFAVYCDGGQARRVWIPDI